MKYERIKKGGAGEIHVRITSSRKANDSRQSLRGKLAACCPSRCAPRTSGCACSPFVCQQESGEMERQPPPQQHSANMSSFCQ